MSYRIQKLSEDFYAFSVWDKDHLLFLYTGKSKAIKQRARKFNYNINLRMQILNRSDYKLSHISG